MPRNLPRDGPYGEPAPVRHWQHWLFYVAMDTDIRIGDELPAEHRGPHALAVLGAFMALVAVALAVILGLTSFARLLDRLA